ncbi:MAG: DUF1629 domain-containing protein [Pseudomonadota bacterium]
MIWSMGCRMPYERAINVGWISETKPQIEYADTTPDYDSMAGFFRSYHANAGRAVIPETVPKIVSWGHSRITPLQAFGIGRRFIVDTVFQDIVERFEPEKHQFIPVEVVNAKSREPLCQRFFFNICTRIDSISKEKTTAIQPKNNGYEPTTGEIVFDTSLAHGHFLWVDRLMLGGTYANDQIHAALAEANISGLSFSLRNSI